MPDPLPASNPILSQHVPEAILSSDWVVVTFCLLACAFFSGLEIAFLSANKLRIELQSKQGNYTAKILARYVKNPSDFISTVLVANNLALVIYGIYMGRILDVGIGDLIHSTILKFSLVTVISTFIVLITAEFLPKSIFRINPDVLLSALILPFRLIHVLLFPLIYFVKKVSSFLLKVFTKTTITDSTPVFSKVDLDNYIASLENTGQAENQEVDTEVFRNALEFSDLKVRDFMIPRTELIALDINESVEVLKKLFIETRLSKILIYRENIDHIIGFVHQSEILDDPDTILRALKPVLIVNESMQAHSLLRDFIQKRRSISVVVDEFGGTAGIATLEDVIEEIFGEIEDEFDVEELTEKQISEYHFLFNARLEIDYLNEKYDLGIPEGDYSTLGGFVIFICGKIPRVRETIRQGKFEFLVTRSKGAKLEEVELQVHHEED
ncbi:MAG: HlyC/CorC family transporter [Bacteroidetes bacterium]|nr:HlyC/CorC family transporter [Bacteroidota bacterium]